MPNNELLRHGRLRGKRPIDRSVITNNVVSISEGSREMEVAAGQTSTMPVITEYLGGLRDLLGQLPVDRIAATVNLVREARRAGNVVFVCGNGGSASTASHFAVDLAKTATVAGQARLRAMALTDNVGLITAWGNDTSYENIFAEQLANYIQPNDLLIAVSASGNSPNVLRAVELANERGAITIGLSGYEGGKLRALSQLSIVVPCDNMQQIEDVHLIVNHLLVTCLRQIE